MCMIAAAADGHIIVVVVHVHVAAAVAVAGMGSGYKHLICQLRITTGAHFLLHTSYVETNQHDKHIYFMSLCI